VVIKTAKVQHEVEALGACRENSDNCYEQRLSLCGSKLSKNCHQRVEIPMREPNVGQQC